MSAELGTPARTLLSVAAVGLGAWTAGQRSYDLRLIGKALPSLSHLDEKCLELEVRRLARLLKAARGVLLILFRVRGLCRQASPLGNLPNGQLRMIGGQLGRRLVVNRTGRGLLTLKGLRASLLATVAVYRRRMALTAQCPDRNRDRTGNGHSTTRSQCRVQ